ncbi:family 16 glycosylhydrolase [Accumulibacter sp.]|uniref:family 16 glycosylhydrolase n=1 Tax=Accumulibacter sp. TaxID=2053492 RepID=UPI002624E0BC|nr:family 16 glycosylhydrolase [Accumulibacter sp.]
MSTLFSDDFNTPGPDVNRAIWTTPTGDAAFFGRTAIRNPDSTSNGSGRIAVSDGVAHLLLSTYNPTASTAGDSFWGSEIDSIESFGFGEGVAGLEFSARVRSPEHKPPGLVTSIFGYKLLSEPPPLKNEIDWEFLSNFYQPAIDPPRALINHYAAEPVGPGHPHELAFPSGFDFTDFHTYAIRYYQASGESNEGRIEWLVDGVPMHFEESNVPTGDLSVNLNIWAPAADFHYAYSPALQPIPNPLGNVDYDYEVDWVSVTSTTTPFFDDHDFAAQAKILPGVIEPTVPIYYNGTLVGGHNHHAVELFDQTPNASGFPSTFVDLVANTYVRATYQKPDGSSGPYGTSFAATFSYRTADGAQDLVYLPSVDRGDISTGGSAKYTGVVSGHFGSVAITTSTRSFSDPTFDFTRVGVAMVLEVQQDVTLATGSTRLAGDVLRAGTLASMFSTQQQFDASLLLWEDAEGQVHSLQLDGTTARDAHLFGAAQELGTWIELVKGAGSSWHPDSPTVRLVISNPNGLRLGVQGFLANTLDPNDDSLSVWPELLDPPSSLVPGASYAVDLEVFAVAPLTDNTTYVTPFSARLEGAPFSNASLSGTANINAMGNHGDNVLQGNSGNNRLDGYAGNDTLDGNTGVDDMAGGTGDDSYLVGSNNDLVTELPGEGIDLVQSSASNYFLSANVEQLTLVGNAAINGTGNSLDNLITGNSAANLLTGYGGNDHLLGDAGSDTLIGGGGNDTLDGGTGVDDMAGGTGDDSYLVGSNNDLVTELAGEGTDLVQSSASDYFLSANVEHLTLLGSAAINGTGNSLDNLITGNSAANILTGYGGNDHLVGDAGSDTLIGGGGNDTLDGGTGVDDMAGGTGDDSYLVGSNNDLVTELPGEGTDLVQSSASNYLLTANVEHLTLVGSAAINGTGNGRDNLITGNSAANLLTGYRGNDTLVGGGGNDTLDGNTGVDEMAGGTGDDSYLVNSTNDLVIELPGEGTDLVQSSASNYFLSANVEHLTLLGSAAINGTGNGLDNRITGNSAANLLTGYGGDDTLIGGLGNDTLVGSGGLDLFRFDTALDAGTNLDTIIDFNVTDDSIELENGIFGSLTSTGSLAAGSFRAAAGVSAADADDFILYDSASGALYYDADGNAAGAAVQFASLSSGLALSNADFLVT